MTHAPYYRQALIMSERITSAAGYQPPELPEQLAEQNVTLLGHVAVARTAPAAVYVDDNEAEPTVAVYRGEMLAAQLHLAPLTATDCNRLTEPKSYRSRVSAAGLQLAIAKKAVDEAALVRYLRPGDGVHPPQHPYEIDTAQTNRAVIGRIVHLQGFASRLAWRQAWQEAQLHVEEDYRGGKLITAEVAREYRAN